MTEEELKLAKAKIELREEFFKILNESNLEKILAIVKFIQEKK